MSCEQATAQTLKETGHRLTPQRLMILSAIRHADGHKTASEILEDVKESFGLEALPAEVLADGMMASGENLADLAERDVTLYSPIPVKDQTNNPALRDDLSQAVAESDWDRLPTKTVTVTVEGTKQKQQQIFL